MGAAWGAIAGAVGSLAGSFIQNAGAANRQRRANRDNINFWNMQNEYNTPSAQMQRLKDAGLNPNLIYGTSPTSAVGNAGAISPAKAAPYKMDNPLLGMQLYADIKQREAQTDNLKSQNTVIQQEAALKGMQTAKTAADASTSETESEVAKALKQNSIDFARESLRKIEAQRLGVDLDNTFKDQSMKDRLKQIHYQARTAKANLSGTELLNELRRLEVDLKKLGVERGDAWYFRILGRHFGEQINKTINQVKQ